MSLLYIKPSTALPLDSKETHCFHTGRQAQHAQAPKLLLPSSPWSLSQPSRASGSPGMPLPLRAMGSPPTAALDITSPSSLTHPLCEASVRALLDPHPPHQHGPLLAFFLSTAQVTICHTRYCVPSVTPTGTSAPRGQEPWSVFLPAGCPAPGTAWVSPWPGLWIHMVSMRPQDIVSV